jgi:5-methylcytosine-specific restriction endonuclease McrA
VKKTSNLSPDQLIELRAKRAAYMRRYNARPEAKLRNKERNLRYKSQRREKLAAQESARYYANHEKALEYRRQYRHSLSPEEKARQQQIRKEWAQQNPDRVAASYQRRKHTDAYRYKATEQKGKRKARVSGARIERINWRQVWSTFDGTCNLCKKELRIGVHTYHFDHIVALSRGGAHSTDNLQIVHAKCNLSKNRY